MRIIPPRLRFDYAGGAFSRGLRSVGGLLDERRARLAKMTPAMGESDREGEARLLAELDDR